MFEKEPKICPNITIYLILAKLRLYKYVSLFNWSSKGREDKLS